MIYMYTTFLNMLILIDGLIYVNLFLLEPREGRMSLICTLAESTMSS